MQRFDAEAMERKAEDVPKMKKRQGPMDEREEEHTGIEGEVDAISRLNRYKVDR